MKTLDLLTIGHIWPSAEGPIPITHMERTHIVAARDKVRRSVEAMFRDNDPGLPHRSAFRAADLMVKGSILGRAFERRLQQITDDEKAELDREEAELLRRARQVVVHIDVDTSAWDEAMERVTTDPRMERVSEIAKRLSAIFQTCKTELIVTEPGRTTRWYGVAMQTDGGRIINIATGIRDRASAEQYCVDLSTDTGIPHA